MHTMATEALKLSQVGSMGWTLVGGRGYQRLHIASFMPSAAQNIAVLYWKECLAYGIYFQGYVCYVICPTHVLQCQNSHRATLLKSIKI